MDVYILRRTFGQPTETLLISVHASLSGAQAWRTKPDNPIVWTLDEELPAAIHWGTAADGTHYRIDREPLRI